LSNLKKHIIFSLLLFAVLFSLGVKAIHTLEHLHENISVCVSDNQHFHQNQVTHKDFICETKFSFVQIHLAESRIVRRLFSSGYLFFWCQNFYKQTTFSLPGRSPPAF